MLTAVRRAIIDEVPVGLVVVGLVAALCMAVTISINPVVAAALVPIFLFVIAYSQRPLSATVSGISILLGALLVLGYGFANVGINLGNLPIPAAEVALLSLSALVVFRTQQMPSSVLVPLILFGGFVGVRLIADYPRWGTLAVRDATLAFDAVAVVIGFGLVRLGRSDQLIRNLKAVFILTLVYGTFYPWREQLASLGPNVGLRQNVPLLGSMSGIGVGIAASFLYFAIFSRGLERVFLMAWSLALVAVLQERGLYLALPVSILVMRVSGGSGGRKILRRSVVAALICLATLFSLGPLDLQGRLGSVAPAFYISHLATLLGQSGPSAGSLTHRLALTQGALNEFTQTPVTLIVGAGLGPDLASGFMAGGTDLVRKPHNDFLEALVRLGILGAAFFFWLLLALLRPIVHCARNQSDDHRGVVCTWVVGVSTLYLLISATQPLLAYPFGAIPLFLFLGIGSGLAYTTNLVVPPSMRKGTRGPLINGEIGQLGH